MRSSFSSRKNDAINYVYNNSMVFAVIGLLSSLMFSSSFHTNAFVIKSSPILSPSLSSLSPPSTSRAANTYHNHHSRISNRISTPSSSTRTTSLSLFNNNNNKNKNDKNANKNNKNDDTDKVSMVDKVQNFYEQLFTSIEEFIEDNIFSKLSPEISTKIKDFVNKVKNDIFPSMKLASIGFITGSIITISLILFPVYDSIEMKVVEPVTLFETILTDLDKSYVDKVDTEKLFETGVSAMLRSLDPYTEFETKDDAKALSESIGGKYGGVGLVISGTSSEDVELYKKLQKEQQISSSKSSKRTYDVINTDSSASSSMLLPQDAINDQQQLNNGGDDGMSSTPVSSQADDKDLDLIDLLDDDDDEEVMLPSSSNKKNKKPSKEQQMERQKAIKKAMDKGIRVVTAFEGYAFDYGMRVGDKIVAINDNDITPTTTVDNVRDMLRGEPNTPVKIAFERDGVQGVNTITMPRTIVQLRDVQLATLLGDPADGIGYIQLTGFAANAGREVRQSILALQIAAAESAPPGSDFHSSLKGLILDLRGNPGGLLSSSVDVASQLVPKGSDIVSAKGRGFPGVLYRSRADPILSSKTKLAVLINGGTASAAEIVSGAVQDLDVGIIVGADRTFGKGLVQNVEDLPFNTALKYTVAKYYTPSGRCIQGINYKEGGGNGREGSDVNPSYTAKKVREKDKSIFYTKNGREVRDGGGVEADYKVKSDKVSVLEVTLLRSGVLQDFASQWSKTHELTNNFDIDEKTYQEFISYVNNEQKSGNIKLEALYTGPIKELKRSLEISGYKGSTKELDQLQQSILKEVQKDFNKYSSEIKEDLSQTILARYLPDSMLIERGVKKDKQVNAAIKLIKDGNGRKFDQLLARSSGSNAADDGNPTKLQANNNKGKSNRNNADTLSSSATSTSSINTATSSSSTTITNTNNIKEDDIHGAVEIKW